MIKIETTDSSVLDAFNRVIAADEDPEAILLAIGEAVLLPLTKQRFDTSTDPYGVPWEPLKTRQGKPLIGESKSLSTQFAYRAVDRDTVTLTSLMSYAAMQNFGGKVTAKNAKSLFFMVGSRKVFVNSVAIPARQFFPDEARGLPGEYADGISGLLRSVLQNAWDGKS